MEENPKFQFQGIDHIALTCSDMAATTEFYHGKLGMPILHTIEYENEAGEKVGQHFFFGVGDGDAHIAMFYWRDGYQTIKEDYDAAVSAAPHPVNFRSSPIGSFGHLNLRVPAEKIEGYCDRLEAEGIPYYHIVRYRDPDRPEVMRSVRTDNGFGPIEEGALMSSVYFHDPDGLMLEFNAWLPAWESWPKDHAPWAEPVSA
jgi:catechol 2,3-dioxygenase-like lactoylglutathione lyase family enzyme